MNFLQVLIFFSSLSFVAYGMAYFVSPKMKHEFKRFGLERFGTLTALLELMGGVGLLLGLKYEILLIISSAGLTLLMLLGLIVRIKVKDSFLVSLPALLFMLLNGYILFFALKESYL